MGAFIATALLFAALFFVSFITKRRFGLLGLALSAGALLSMHWAGALTPWLESQGFQMSTPPLSAVVQIVLTLLPAVVLLFNGPAHTRMMPRVIGSLAFATLATVYLSDILATILVLNGPSSSLFVFLHDYKSLIVTAGIAVSVLDMVLTRKPKHSKEGRKSAH